MPYTFEGLSKLLQSQSYSFKADPTSAGSQWNTLDLDQEIKGYICTLSALGMAERLCSNYNLDPRSVMICLLSHVFG